MAKYYIGFGVLTAVVLALVVYGFTVIGTPSQRQASIFDSTRISNFRSISYEVDYYYQKNNQLPMTLSEVPSISYYNKDPQTTTGYDYMKVGDTSFKLCANFSEDSSKEKKDTDNYLYYDTEVPSPSQTTSSVSLTQYNSGYDTPSSTTHKKGYDCITYNVPSSYMKSATDVPTIIQVPVTATVVNPTVKLTYDGDVLKWDDDFTKSNYSLVTLSLTDAKGAQLLGYNAKGLKVYRPYFSNWKKAVLKVQANGYLQAISNEVTNTTYKECSTAGSGICYR